jgi:hypothetical protein
MRKTVKILLSVVVIAIVIFSARDTMPVQMANYYVANKLVNAGLYKTFYWSIERRLLQNDEMAKKVLTYYFLMAIKDGDLEATRYYLQQRPTLIDAQYADSVDGTAMIFRSTTVALLGDFVTANAANTTNATINIDMLKLLLEYHPDLNYALPSGRKYNNGEEMQISLLAFAVSNYDIDVITLLIENGADVNFHFKRDAPLSISYMFDKFDIFKLLLQKGAKLRYGEDKIDSVVVDIAMDNSIEFKCPLGAWHKEPANKSCFYAVKNENYQKALKKNTRYMQEVFLQVTDFSEADREGFTILAEFFTASNQIDEMGILLEHDLCKISNCDEILRVAKMNDNKEVIAIVEKQKTSK